MWSCRVGTKTRPYTLLFFFLVPKLLLGNRHVRKALLCTIFQLD
jgi:hypothetical protein